MGAEVTTIEARATCHLPGLGLDQVVLVDPERPYIRMLLDNGHLVRTGRAPQEAPEPPGEPKTPARAKAARKKR